MHLQLPNLCFWTFFFVSYNHQHHEPEPRLGDSHLPSAGLADGKEFIGRSGIEPGGILNIEVTDCSGSRVSATPPMGGCEWAQDITSNVEIGGEQLIRDLAPRWRELCDEVRCAPFQRPEWIGAYIRAFEPRSEIVLATAYAGSRLTAVLPMIRKNAFCAGVPLVKLTCPANSHSVQFDVLRAPGAIGQQSTRAIWHSLKSTPGWQVLEFSMFPWGGVCSELLTLAGEDKHPILTMVIQNSPVLRLRVGGDGAAQVVSGPSRHFRHELRRYARIFAEQTGKQPTVIRCTNPSPGLLEQFFDLESSGRKGRERSAINCEPQTRMFYEEIARVGKDNGYFCMHSLLGNGKIAAAAFSVVTEDCFFPMKIAHDESLRRSGPGHLLFNAIVSECAQKQVPTLFFGGTDERFKTMWTQETIFLLRSFVFASDIRSRLAYRLRESVITPLGKLRWGLKTVVRRKKVTFRRRPDTLIATTNKGVDKLVTPVHE
jgi:CelD/BcsL family acetyltransferase involved in cellulose biosynthesis